MKKKYYSRKRFLFTLALVFFASMVLVATLHEDGLLAVHRMEDQLIKLRTDNESLKIENRQLAHEVHDFKTNSSGIEKIAREKLNMVKPGELVFRIVPQSATLSFSENSSDS